VALKAIFDLGGYKKICIPILKKPKKKNFPSANQKLAFPKPSIEAKIRFFINTK